MRVSGWSREAGFFASLITITFMIYLCDKQKKKNIFQFILFAIGYFISFSKASFSFIILLIILLFKKQLTNIAYGVSVLTFIVTVIIASNYLEKNNVYVYANESIIHRISGYSIIADLNVSELLLGVDKIENINEQALKKHNYLSYIYKLQEFCGIPNLIVHYGMIIFFIFILLLRTIGFKTPEFLILTITTMTTDYFTSTSFVILTYFLCICLITERNALKNDT